MSGRGAREAHFIEAMIHSHEGFPDVPVDELLPEADKRGGARGGDKSNEVRFCERKSRR